MKRDRNVNVKLEKLTERRLVAGKYIVRIFPKKTWQRLHVILHDISGKEKERKIPRFIQCFV